MSRNNRVVFGVTLLISIICILFMVLYSGYMSRKIAKVYANKDNVKEVKKPTPLFDINDEEATRTLLDKVNGLGKEIADIQNQYRLYYKELRILDEGSERDAVLAKVNDLNHTMTSYFKDDVLDDNWELFDVNNDWEWKFEPIYQYGGEKIPVCWILQDKKEPTTHYMIVTASYGLKREMFINGHSYLTSEGSGVLASLNEEGSFANSDDFLDMLKQIGEDQKEKGKKYNEEHNVGPIPDQESQDELSKWEEEHKDELEKLEQEESTTSGQAPKQEQNTTSKQEESTISEQGPSVE